MEPLNTALLGLIAIIAWLTAIWGVQLVTRDAGLVDVAWSAAVGLLAALYAALGSAPAGLRLLLAVLALVWAARLAGHLALRMRGQPEDARYAAARRAWGRRASLYMLLFFWFQALAGWVLALPFLVVAYRPEAPALGWVLAAVAVWLVAVAGEALADRQLQRFKHDPDNAGRVCATGLWRYSRHPNYFFETLHWLTYVLLAMGAPYGWASLIGPALMAWLLLKVSGIPTVESGEGRARRIGYDDYVRRTSAFIPLPPKKS